MSGFGEDDYGDEPAPRGPGRPPKEPGAEVVPLEESAAARRRAVIRGLMARGTLPQYGFNRVVREHCEREGIPCTAVEVSRDIKAVKEAYSKQANTHFSKALVEDMLIQQLRKLGEDQNDIDAILDHLPEITRDSPDKEKMMVARLRDMKVKRSADHKRTLLAVIGLISDIGGFKAVKKVSVTFSHILRDLPRELQQRLADMQDGENWEEIIREYLPPDRADDVMREFARIQEGVADDD